MYRTSTIIHASTQANFTAYTYDQVIVGGDAVEPVVINGCYMELSPCSCFNVRVTSISGGTHVYLIGNAANIFEGSTHLP